jgi:hypothetical protein
VRFSLKASLNRLRGGKILAERRKEQIFLAPRFTEKRPFKLFLINNGFQLLGLLVMERLWRFGFEGVRPTLFCRD